MRRLLWAIAALALLATAAPAKILVVTERSSNEKLYGADDHTNQVMQWQEQRLLNGFLDICRKTNANVDVVPAEAMQTAWARDGVFWRGAAKTQYDGVVIVNFRGRLNRPAYQWTPAAPSFVPFYPCSLTLTSMYPNVPQLWLTGALGSSNADSTKRSLLGVAYNTTNPVVPACSCGVARYNIGVSSTFAKPSIAYAIDANKAWFSGSNIVRNASYASPNQGYRITYTASGGTRPLLLAYAPYDPGVSGYIVAGNADTLNPARATNDTCNVWELLLKDRFTTPTVANTRITIANVMGISPCQDSTMSINSYAYNDIPCEFDEAQTMWCLAHLDSLTGGKVWDKPAGVTVQKAAVTIDGAFSRGGYRFAGGIVPSDSAAFIASLDSIKTLGIPVTVGVNVDSMATYASEKNWWWRAGSVRYSPQAWAGLKFAEDGSHDSTKYAALASSTTLPVDVFGRFRKRQAYGDGTDTSSVYSGLVNSRSLLAAYFPGQVSGLLMAPLDDYSPKNLGWPYGAGTTPDSLLWVINKAGFTCLRTDVQSADADPNRYGGNKNLVRGYWTTQGYVYSPLIGAPFKVLGCNVASISGSQWQYPKLAALLGYSDSTDFAYSAGVGIYMGPIITKNVARFWHGFVHDKFTDVDVFPAGGYHVVLNGGFGEGIFWPLEDGFSPMRHASILKMHASDFGSGSPGTLCTAGINAAGASSVPAKRPGWWTLKSIASQFAAINAAAGRTVCVFTWPEDIEP